MTSEELRTERFMIHEEIRAAIDQMVTAIRMRDAESDAAVRRSIVRWIGDLARLITDRRTRLKALETMPSFTMVD